MSISMKCHAYQILKLLVSSFGLAVHNRLKRLRVQIEMIRRRMDNDCILILLWRCKGEDQLI